jgi:hypothetical protein
MVTTKNSVRREVIDELGSWRDAPAENGAGRPKIGFPRGDR